MYHTEQTQPLSVVELEKLPEGKTRVLLRKNITEEKRKEEGVAYSVYTADETYCVVDGELTAEYVEEHFEEYWYLAEHGETWEDRYSRLVDKYIREEYSQSAVEALNFNYLKDHEKYQEEVDRLQAYRDECKERAMRTMKNEFND